MSPTPHKQLEQGSLCRAARQTRTLKQAWDHVRARAIKSRNQKTRAAAADFLSNEFANLRNLQETLRSGNFRFSQQHGFLKKRGAGKKPRPIVTSSIPDRIVNRAILDVCQSQKGRIRSLLGGPPYRPCDHDECRRNSTEGRQRRGKLNHKRNCFGRNVVRSIGHQRFFYTNSKAEDCSLPRNKHQRSAVCRTVHGSVEHRVGK